MLVDVMKELLMVAASNILIHWLRRTEILPPFMAVTAVAIPGKTLSSITSSALLDTA